AAAGHQVTLLFLGGDWCENLTIDYWIEDYARKGINFVPLPSPPDFEVDAVWPIKKAYEAYLWLKDKEFDVIHFSEWCGPGFFSMLAKRQGLAFGSTTFCVHTHGPTLWHKLSNGDYLENVLDLQLDFMERQSVLMADVLVTPSKYLIEWMMGQKWTLPEKVYLQQYVMPRTARAEARVSKPASRQINEIVFFGRLEERKGLILFCDALDRLAKQRVKAFTITFLGKIAAVQGINSVDYIRKRAEKWPWKYQIISDKDQPGALMYLQRQGVMAVMPSLADNLPNTVLECLGGGIPFLASNAGGIPEMIAREDIPNVCFELRPDDFSEKMRKALLSGLSPARVAIDIQENEKAWVQWHDQGLPGVKENVPPMAFSQNPSQPLVSVCIPHYNRPVQLKQAITSIEQQSYPNFEVIVVDDGSTQAEAKVYLKELEKKFAPRGWKVLYQKNSYPGAARNHAARFAKGEYLFFMDDDNLAKPNELETFVKVAQVSGAGILTCMSDLFMDHQNPLETTLTGYKRLL
ncbi:MAG: glycosyltransferase, partial [Anaerolineales bacterium]